MNKYAKSCIKIHFVFIIYNIYLMFVVILFKIKSKITYNGKAVGFFKNNKEKFHNIILWFLLKERRIKNELCWNSEYT